MPEMAFVKKEQSIKAVRSAMLAPTHLNAIVQGPYIMLDLCSCSKSWLRPRMTMRSCPRPFKTCRWADPSSIANQAHSLQTE